MPRGGIRLGSGPQPDPNSARSKAKAARAAGVKVPRKRKAAPAVVEVACEVLDALPTEPAAPGAPDEPVIRADTPLELLLNVVKDTGIRLAIRMQAASIAAPFVHAKPAPAGKKEAKTEAAKGAGTGKFAASAPPLRVVTR